MIADRDVNGFVYAACLFVATWCGLFGLVMRGTSIGRLAAGTGMLLAIGSLGLYVVAACFGGLM